MSKMILCLLTCCFMNFSFANDEKTIYNAVINDIQKDVLNSDFSRYGHIPTLYTLVLKDRTCLHDIYINQLVKDKRIAGVNYTAREDRIDLNCRVQNLDYSMLTINSQVKLSEWPLYSQHDTDLYDMTNYRYESLELLRIQFTEIKIQDNIAVVVALVKIGNGSVRAGNAYLFEFEKGNHWQLKNKFLVE